MKEFTSISPDVAEVTAAALRAAVTTLPGRVCASYVNILTAHILRTAKTGERDVAVLREIALAELHVLVAGFRG